MLTKSNSVKEDLHEVDGWSSYAKRKSAFAKSKLVEFNTPLDFLDLFRCGKYFPAIALDIRMTRTDDGFLLEGARELAGRFRLKLIDVQLNIRYVHLAPNIVEAHRKQLQLSPYQFNFVDNRLKQINIPPGTVSLNLPHVYLNRLPRVVYCALVDTNALTGSSIGFDRDRFHFGQYDLSYIAVKKDGIVQSSAHQFSFGADGSGQLKAFRALQTSVGISDNFGSSNDLKYSEFLDSKYIIAFNFIADLSNFCPLTSGSSGELSLDLMFRNETNTPLTLLLYSSYNALLTIDNLNNVTNIVF